MAPTLGRIVHYVLSASDATLIRIAHPDPVHANPVAEGDVCAAVVVRVFSTDCANLQILLDGDGSYWATSRTEGDTPGSWHWPERV